MLKELKQTKKIKYKNGKLTAILNETSNVTASHSADDLLFANLLSLLFLYY